MTDFSMNDDEKATTEERRAQMPGQKETSKRETAEHVQAAGPRTRRGDNDSTNQRQNPGNNADNRNFLNSLITNEVYQLSFPQEMAQRLEFLKFLITSAEGMLKTKHIQILWECLFIHSYYDGERDAFFSWCIDLLKAMQNSTYNSGIFNDDCMEMLFFDLLLKLDFRYISEAIYDCFEKFFIYINAQYGQISCASAFDFGFEVFETKLIGVEALWEIVLTVRSQKVY